MGTGNVHNNLRGTSMCHSTGYDLWLSGSETGIKIILYIWQRKMCYFSLTLEQVDFFPIVPSFAQSNVGQNPGGPGTPMNRLDIKVCPLVILSLSQYRNIIPIFAIILFSGTELRIIPFFLEQVERAIDSAAHPHSRFKGVPHSRMIIMIDKTWQLIAGKHKPSFLDHQFLAQISATKTDKPMQEPRPVIMEPAGPRSKKILKFLVYGLQKCIWPKLLWWYFLFVNIVFVFQICQPQTKETIVSRANEPLVGKINNNRWHDAKYSHTLKFVWL